MFSVDYRHILDAIGWTGDASLMPAANAENLQLMNSIKELAYTKQTRQELIQRNSQRIKHLTEQLDGARKSSDELAKIHYNLRFQENEEHRKSQLIKNEISVLQDTVKKLNKSTKETQELLEKNGKEIDMMNGNIAKAASEMEWARTALAEWNQISAQRNNTNVKLEQFRMADEREAEKLIFRRETVQRQVEQERQKLHNTFMEKKSMEQVLERTSRLYRQLDEERNQLVSNFCASSKMLTTRERDLEEAEKTLEESQKETATCKSNLHDANIVYETQLQNNDELQAQIFELSQTAPQLRQTLEQQKTEHQLKQHESQISTKYVAALSKQLIKARGQLRRNGLIHKEKLKKREVESKSLDAVKMKLKALKENQDRKLRKDKLRSFLADETNEIERLSTEKRRLDNAIYRQQDKLRKLVEEVKTMQFMKQGTKSTLKSETSALAKSKDMLYWHRMAQHKLEIQVAAMRAKDSIGKQSTKDFTEKLRKLTADYDDRTKHLGWMIREVQRAQLNYKRIKDSHMSAVVECSQLEDQIRDCQRKVETNQKMLEKRTRASENFLIEKNCLKMRVQQMEQLLQRQAHKKMNLDRHKTEMEIGREQQLTYYNFQFEKVEKERRLAKEINGKIKKDLNEIALRIEAFRRRFQKEYDLLGRNDDGTVMTETHRRIQLYQETQLLLREGNELNGLIVQAEKEIRALEVTVAALTSANDSYKRHVEGGDVASSCKEEEISAEEKQLAEVQKQYCCAVTKLKEMEINFAKASKEMHGAMLRLDETNMQIEDKRVENTSATDELFDINKEVYRQSAKIQRAERELKNAIKLAKQHFKSKETMKLISKDMMSRELETVNTKVLQNLSDLVEKHPDLGPSIVQKLYDRGLHMPTPTAASKSRSSFRTNDSADTLRNDSSNRLNVAESERDLLIADQDSASSVRTSAVSLNDMACFDNASVSGNKRNQ